LPFHSAQKAAESDHGRHRVRLDDRRLRVAPAIDAQHHLENLFHRRIQVFRIRHKLQ
jgi:hypothetical protein